ncbi:ferredoxin [Lachnospiraceae bacterium]|nr:ferredoxin [Lachnospiraceae bacterium]
MIKRTGCKKENCCGCQACADLCPAGAIHMCPDQEGFWYPQTDPELCTGCGRCERICPVNDRSQGKEEERYFGVQAKDDTIRYASSSGGMFTLLAHAVLNRQGIVYGAGYSGNMEVEHRKICDKGRLETIRRTKYVQSSMKGVYREIQKDLQLGSWVMFCGTPCQAQALRQFLDGEDDRLLLVDLVCYGVGSPGIWKDYVTDLERRYKGKLKDFSFRDKRNRDHGQTRSFVIGESEIVNTLYQDAYCRMYFRNYSIRPSCHHCSFCGIRRSSDFTIGDFWGVENVRPDFDDGMGTSLVIAHTEKAKEFWKEIEKDARWFACQKEDVLQPRLREPTKAAGHRKLFMELYRRLPFSLLMKLVGGRR